MAITIQNFINWSSDTEKKIGSYIKPTSESEIILETNLIWITNNILFQNLETGDKVSFSSDTDILPLNLQGYKYINKKLNSRVSIHDNRQDSLNNENSLTVSGLDNYKIKYDYNLLFKSLKNGVTGNFEPIWQRKKGSITKDNNIEWITINPLYSEYDSLQYIPKNLREKPLYMMYSELFNHILGISNEEEKSISNKYTDFLNLDSIYLKEILYEFGYDYLANSALLETEDLAVLLAYLKVIHLLKGTRQGLKLSLELLKYPNNDILWYEKEPRGEPHTFDLNLQFNYENFTPRIIGNLTKFLRSYVYPICNLQNEILPFKLLTSYSGGGVISRKNITFSSEFTIPEIIIIDPEIDLTSDSATINFTKNELINELYIELSTDIDFENIILSEIISTETYNFSDLEPETTYYGKIKAVGIENDWILFNFTTLGAIVLFAFYFKSIDFGNGWRGTLYAKNLESGNEYIVDTNVSVLNNWLMPRTSSNGKYIAYHTTTGGGLFDFKIKDLETGTIIYAVNDNWGDYFFCNWWANDSDRITNLYRNRTYTISTNNLNTSSPDSSFYSSSWKHIITNKTGNTAYYWGNNYGFAMRKRDINGTNFSFIGAPDGYYKSVPIIDEAEDFICYGGENGGITSSRIYKLNLNTGIETTLFSYSDFSNYIDALAVGRIIDNKFYVNHKIGSDRYLKYIDLSNNSLNLVEQNNDMDYLCDVNKCDPEWFI